MPASDGLDLSDPIVKQALDGDRIALAELFDKHRDRLRRMIDLRMDRRMQPRVSTSDVLQEAYVELAKQLANYARNPQLPFYLWVRRITGQRLAKLHRQHLGTEKRDAKLEVRLHRGAMPGATSFALASKLIGGFTSVTEKAIRTERQLQLQEALNTMEEADREVLAMRHFEQLSNSEIATELGISYAAVGMRYMRALRRLKEILSNYADFQITEHSAELGEGE